MQSAKRVDLIGHNKLLPWGQLNGCSVTRVWLARLPWWKSYSKVVFKALILLVNLLYTTIHTYAGLPRRLKVPTANVKSGAQQHRLCEGGLGEHPQKILHALKCVLVLRLFFVHAHSTYINPPLTSCVGSLKNSL